MRPARLVLGGSLLLFVLACTGGAPAPDPKPEAPTAEPAEPAPRDRGDRKAKARPGGRGGASSEDCTVGLTGVLTGAPGFPAGEGGHGRHDEDVVVRAGPEGDAKVIATITTAGITSVKGKPLCAQPDCAYLTWTYDGHGMPAYDNRSGFVQVGLGTGGHALADGTCGRRGWVGMDGPMAYRKVGDLVTGHLISFKGWDGLVSDSAGAKGRAVEAGAIQVEETREVDGQLWMRGALLTGRGCEGEPRQVGEGWVPVHSKGGALQISLYESC